MSATCGALADDSPPQLLRPEGLLLLPILVAVSLSILVLTFVIPPIYRKIRTYVRPANYDLLADEDEEVEPEAAPYMPSGGLVSDFKLHVRSLKEYGTFLFLMEILRSLALVALLGLSIHAAVQAEPSESSGHFDAMKKHRKKKHKHNKLILGEYTPLELGEFGTVAFYVSHISLTLLTLDIHSHSVIPAPDAKTSNAGSPTVDCAPRHLLVRRLAFVRVPGPLSSFHFRSAHYGPRQHLHLG